MLREITAEMYHVLSLNLNFNAWVKINSSTTLENNAHYAIVDESGVGILGVIEVKEGRKRTFAYEESSEYENEDIKNKFQTTEQVSRLQEILKICPFNLIVCINEDEMTLSSPGEWAMDFFGDNESWISERDVELFNSSMIEHKFSISQWQLMVQRIKELNIESRVAYFHVPGKGLGVELE